MDCIAHTILIMIRSTVANDDQFALTIHSITVDGKKAPLNELSMNHDDEYYNFDTSKRSDC